MEPEAIYFRTLADATRLRLLVLLAANGETCVCELAAALDAPEFRVSRHLSILKDRGLVEARRQGTWMHYRLAKPRARIEECLQDCFRDCLAEHTTVVADLQRLRQYRDRTRPCPAAASAPDGRPKHPTMGVMKHAALEGEAPQAAGALAEEAAEPPCFIGAVAAKPCQESQP